MMRISIVLALIGFSWCLNASAAETYRWESDTRVTRPNGRVAHCGADSFSSNTDRGPDLLWNGLLFGLISPNCGVPSAFYGSLGLERRDGKIFFENQEVGSVSALSLNLLHYAADFKELITVTRRRNGNLDYKNVLTYADTLETYTTEASLVRVREVEVTSALR